MSTFYSAPMKIRSNLFSGQNSMLRPSMSHRIRQEPVSVGGCGEFLRSAEILKLMIEKEQEELERILLPALKSLTDRLAPQEAKLEELKQKYQETENAVFGSQIRPLEILIQPLQEMKEEQEFAVFLQQEYIQELTEQREEAISSLDSFRSKGRGEVFYSGYNRTWSVDANKSFALGPDGESDFLLAQTKNGGIEVLTKWQPTNLEQPLLIENHLKADRECHGVVVSFASPEEGPKQLCAVSEWFGDVKLEDVLSRREQLISWIKMDNLKATDASKCLISSWSDQIPLRRRNELWLQVVPPVDEEWLDHAAKIATNLPAKNSSFYQLKDCPWATPEPWGMTDRAVTLENRDEEEEKRSRRAAAVEGAGCCSWALKTSLLGGTNALTISFKPGAGVAVDRSSGGEVAVWSLPVEPDGAGDQRDRAVALYAAAVLEGGWPIRGSAVEATRLGLLESLRKGGEHVATDPLSFRLRVASNGLAELWTRVEAAPS